MQYQKKEAISFLILIILAFWTSLVFLVAQYLPFAMGDMVKFLISLLLSLGNLWVGHYFLIAKRARIDKKTEKKIDEIGTPE